MKIKALKGFGGVNFSMAKGEIRDVDESQVNDLIDCGYVEKVEPEKASRAKKRKGDETQ